DRSRVGKDLGIVAGLAVAAAVLAVGPNLGLAALLFGDAEAPLATFIQPLPTAVAVGVVVLFPATIALSELAAYFGYVRPRLEARFLALQHATLRLVVDWRFVAWRALLFLPFALMVGIVLRWRPRLLAYLAVLHGLADLQVAVMILVEST